MTEAPSAASDSAMADPIPLDAPVTIATLPVSLLRLLPIFRYQTQRISGLSRWAALRSLPVSRWNWTSKRFNSSEE